MSAPERPATRPPEARVGQLLNGKWRIESLIDVGGMGAVYVAVHRNGRRAALKLLHAHLAYHNEIRTRFLREGYVANKINHPGAVAIVDDDVAEDGSPFLVMELLEGESLSKWLSRVGGKLPATEALAVMGQVLEVLAAAHKNEVVHRDIKPGNIFVTSSGHTKLLDFGLARVRDAQLKSAPTAIGTIMGTAGYMAPEQARGRQDEIDARSDLFAVGAVLFRAITGRKVHQKETEFDTTLAAMKDPAPSFATIAPSAGRALVRAIDGALAFNKADRWQTAEDMFHALRLAYEELGRRPPTADAPHAAPASAPNPADAPTALSITVSVSESEPSLVVDVAFGSNHDEAIALERVRTAEKMREISTDASREIDPEASTVDDERTSASPRE